MTLYNVFALLAFLHFYLCIRFVVNGFYKYAAVYSLPLLLLVIFVPFVGYFLAENKLNLKLQEISSEEE